MTENYPEELMIPLGQESPQLTQLRVALYPLTRGQLGAGFSAELAVEDQQSTQVFTKIDSLDDEGVLFFDADGPGRERCSVEAGTGSLQISQIGDSVAVASPFNDMSIEQALTHLERDLPALATALQRERKARITAEQQHEARLEELRDQAHFGPLHLLQEPATPNWFRRYGLSLSQAYELGRHGFKANYAQRIGRRSVAWFSDTFAGGIGDYPMGLALVTSPRGCETSLLYKSNSRAVWRWAPGIADDGWLSKGEFPEAMNLPFELQATLGCIHDRTAGRPKDISPMAGAILSRILVPRVSRSGKNTAPLEAMQFQQLPDAFSIDYTPEAQLPDFSKQQGKVELHDKRGLYGETVVLERYTSYDSSREYVFARSKDGRHVWLSSVNPAHGKIRRRGLVYDAAMPGVELTRPYQYRKAQCVTPHPDARFSGTYGLRDSSNQQKQIVSAYAALVQSVTTLSHELEQ